MDMDCTMGMRSDMDCLLTWQSCKWLPVMRYTNRKGDMLMKQTRQGLVSVLTLEHNTVNSNDTTMLHTTMLYATM